MGFFNKCSEALLHLLTFSPFERYFNQQPLDLQPLPLEDITIRPDTASPGFKCRYPAMSGWTSCNNANNRDCWLKDSSSQQPLFSQFDINTNYEGSWPEGIHREYFINVTDATISPDGYLKTSGKVINGTYPGPLIEACWGDNITVHVTNFLTTNGSTIHWHGVRQLHTNQADGVNGVTQCPIATSETYTYNFRATQYGHTWYHSHYSLQYPDGAAGPLLIHGPSSGNWDKAWDPVLISDWSHNSAFADFQIELGKVESPGDGENVTGKEPPMQTVLLNGTGNFPCDPAKDSKCLPLADRKPIFQKVFKKGKRYLLRLINSSTESNFVFTIDNHLLEIISTDFVPIKPFKNESIHIAIGQRYSVIVEANPSTPIEADGNYWIRTISSNGCGTIQNNTNQTGIIRYDPKSTAPPHSNQHEGLNTNCTDLPLDSMVPIVPWAVDTQAVNDVLNDTFEAGLDLNPTHGYIRWDLTDTPLWLNFSSPTILNLHNTTFDPFYAIIEEDYDRGYVYLVITSNQTENEPKIPAPVAHPIHMHGHDFVLLGQSASHYDASESPKTFNFNNPPRRDVALLAAGGYLAIAFKPDNPGVWLLHCHIAWHASSGLALQILERQPDILRTIGSLATTENTCKGWDNWVAVNKIDQDDSGI